MTEGQKEEARQKRRDRIAAKKAADATKKARYATMLDYEPPMQRRVA